VRHTGEKIPPELTKKVPPKVPVHKAKKIKLSSKHIAFVLDSRVGIVHREDGFDPDYVQVLIRRGVLKARKEGRYWRATLHQVQAAAEKLRKEMLRERMTWEKKYM